MNNNKSCFEPSLPQENITIASNRASSRDNAPTLCPMHIEEIRCGNIAFRRSLLPDYTDTAPRGIVTIENLHHHSPHFVSMAVLAVAFADPSFEFDPLSLTESGTVYLGDKAVAWEVCLSSVRYEDASEFDIDLRGVHRRLMIRLPQL